MTTIPSQLPQIVTAARSGALQALALQAGQMLDGKVIGAAPNGGTQVEIRGQMLNLLLPLAAKAGETLKFEVQGSGQQLRLGLQMPPATSPPSSPTSTASAVAGPAPPPANSAPPSPQAGSAAPQAVPSGAALAQPASQPAPPPTQAISSATAIPQAISPAAVAPQPSPAPPASSYAPLPTSSHTPAPATPAPAALPQAAGVQGMATVPVAPSVVTPGQTAPPAMPYPQAGTGGIQPTPVAAASIAPAALAQATAPGALGSIRPVVPVSAATPAASATSNPLPTMTPSQPVPAPSVTAQAALAQMVQASVPRQGAATSLTAALAGIAGKVVLPEPVTRAAQLVMANRVAIDAKKFDGAVLQTAVRGSGIFQETALARGQLPLPQTDMKSALLGLRQTLVTWLGSQAPVTPVAHISPPLKGTVPRARAAETAPVDPAAGPEEVGKQLLERTDSALSRIRLHQHASLPDAPGKMGDWSTDLPVMIGAQQTLLHLQIHRDQHNESDPAAERGWQMRFAISLPDLGEVGAQVTLRGGATGVMLWATEPGTSAALETEIAALRDALASAGLNPGAVIVRHGAPPTPPPAPSGHFVDART